MTQRNSPERAQMLFQRRWEQRNRIGGGKFTPVYRTSPKYRRPAGGFNSHIILTTKTGRLHATKGWRSITEYERTIEHG